MNTKDLLVIIAYLEERIQHLQEDIQTHDITPHHDETEDSVWDTTNSLYKGIRYKGNDMHTDNLKESLMFHRMQSLGIERIISTESILKHEDFTPLKLSLIPT